MKEVVTIEGMKCEGYACNVQENFSTIEGVESVDIDLEYNTPIIESQSEIDKDTLDTVSAETNYSVVC